MVTWIYQFAYDILIDGLKFYKHTFVRLDKAIRHVL